MSNKKSNAKVLSELKRIENKLPKRRRQRRRNRGFSSIPIPAGFASSAVPDFRFRQNRDGSVQAVATEVFPVNLGIDQGLDFIIPATPTKWIATRSQMLASAYSSFRPTKLALAWVPNVGTSVNGSVAVGTVFDGVRMVSGSNLEMMRAVAASNGGFTTPVWAPCASHVRLGTNLRANTFPLFDCDGDDIPFWIVISSDLDSRELGGFLKIEMEFSLHNPLVKPGEILAGTGDGAAVSIEEGKHIIKLKWDDEPGLKEGDNLLVNFGSPVMGTSSVIVQAMKTVVLAVISVVEGYLTLAAPDSFGIQNLNRWFAFGRASQLGFDQSA